MIYQQTKMFKISYICFKLKRIIIIVIVSTIKQCKSIAILKIDFRGHI